MRLKPKERKEQILTVALKIAANVGYANVTRQQVASAANIAPALVSKYFGTMKNFKRSVMRAAIKQEVLPIILDGIVQKEPQALKIPKSLRLKAIVLLNG